MSPDDERYPDHSAELMSLVGQSLGPPEVARDPVNRSMIRHWVEAMGDANPVYTSDEDARSVGLPGVVAPPTMLQAWGMRGLTATLALEAERAAGGRTGDDENTQAQMMRLLDDEGFTSVVATNCEQQYVRPLRLGERLVSSSVVEAISDVKGTGLGVGRFVTTRQDFVSLDDDVLAAMGDDLDPEGLLSSGEPVATMRFRILKFRPGTGAPAPAFGGRAPRSRRTTRFSSKGHGSTNCSSSGAARVGPFGTHRFRPARSAVRSNGTRSRPRGAAPSTPMWWCTIPQVPAFDYPLPIALVELEEGTRLVANLDGLAPEELRIGMPLVAEFVDFDEELSLPVFRPAGVAGRAWRLMDFHFTEEQLAVAEAAQGVVRRSEHGRAGGRRREHGGPDRPGAVVGPRLGRPARPARPRVRGRRWSGSHRGLSHARGSKRSVSRPCPSGRPWCSGRCPWPALARPSSARRCCPAWRPARRSCRPP